MQEQSHAEMYITVDNRNNVVIDYIGGDILVLSMIGALDMAKDWCIKNIQKRGTIPHVNKKLSDTQEKKYNNTQEVVSKKEAIDYYLNVMEKVKDKLTNLSTNGKEKISIDNNLIELI